MTFHITHQNFIKEINMKKPTYLNICINIFLKYLIFYLFLMILNDDFKLLQLNNIRNGEDLFYYIWIVLFFPILDIILFSAPLYFSFKIKKGTYFILSILLIIFIEYFLYAYFTSQKVLNQDAFLKIIISIALLFTLFYRDIFNKFKQIY